jgi:heme-degrading monooxygenase HmoA
MGAMYIAMNQFRVRADACDDFERAWRERKSFLAGFPGFREFHLLRGPVEGEARLYASHTTWDDEGAFRAWTESDAFHKAHAQGGKTTAYLLGPPRFIGWQSVDMPQPG